jgi:uncharacterized 2Fe-2S/4Fe-4S cluster protein (DUF4445 family)
MDKDTVKVIFQPSGRRGRVPRGTTIVEAARMLGVGIETLCGGHQFCGKCKVRVERGGLREFGFASRRASAGPWRARESDHITPAERETGYRLGCVATIQEDILVYVPESSRPGKQVVSKAPRPIAIDPDPAVKTYRVALPKATLADPTADFDRLAQELEADWGLRNLSIDLDALRRLGSALRRGRWEITVSVWMDRDIIRVRPGRAATAYGLALDIGTTTIAGYLCDLQSAEVVATASMMNPQIQFGEDVISRINYCYNDPEGLQRMGAVLMEGLNTLIGRAAERASEQTGRPIRPGDIEDMAVCGNTCMHHLFLGLDPESLGSVPFTPATHHSLNVKARHLGLGIHPAANVYILPNIAGFVGGDNVAVILAEAPQKSDDTVLIIDVGTNGEVVIGNRDRMVCSSCSCATGPALEGAQIEYGVRAAPGAIERVTIDPDTLAVDYKVVGRDAWRRYSEPEAMQTRGICGSAVLDALAELVRAGIVEDSGAFSAQADTERLRRNPETGQNEFVLAWQPETVIGRDIVITQNDIRQIQLAKAAIYTGCKLMLQRMGLERPDRIKIAGAFGNHIDIRRAEMLGLFPDCPAERVAAIGNAAGDGCRMALLNRGKRREADRIARRVEYVELTLMDGFQEQLIEAIHIPHISDAFPYLRAGGAEPSVRKTDCRPTEARCPENEAPAI